MITIKVKECSTLFKDLKAGDVFAFVSAPDVVYIKTAEYHFVYSKCEDCGEENSVLLDHYCVELETGAFYKAGAFEEVILCKKAELVLSV